jgi:hypothetical protein
MRTQPEKGVAPYQIDHKLKAGKHYPKELTQLIDIFTRRAIFPFKINALTETMKYNIEHDLTVIEKLFRGYFLNAANLLKYSKAFSTEEMRKKGTKKFNAEIEALAEKAQKEEGFCDLKMLQGCVRRVNRELKSFFPILHPVRNGYRLSMEPTTKIGDAIRERPWGLLGEAWPLVAKLIDTLDPTIVKECAYCHKIYFSKQRKMYHTECRAKKFSEKYRDEGRNAEKMRAYRLRLKKRPKRRK